MHRHSPRLWAPLAALIAAASVIGCDRVGQVVSRRTAKQQVAAPAEEPVDSAWLAASARANKPVRSGRAAAVIRVAAEDDFAVAAFIRDSLDLEGWPAWITVGPPPRWRVNVPMPRDASKAGIRETTLRQLRASGLEAREASDLVPEGDSRRLRGDFAFGRHAPVLVATRPDLVTRVRWALRPDGGMFIVRVDPEGPGGEAEPDLYATAEDEGGLAFSGQVWDVAPSPDWRYLASAAAHVVVGAGNGGVDPARWQALAAEVREPMLLVRDLAFSMSDETTRFGFALPLIEDRRKPCRSDKPHGCPNGAPATAGGWRVRWLRDGSRAAFGIAPRRPTDDAPAGLWTVVDPLDGQAHGTATDSGDFAAVPWVEGPALEPSVTDAADTPPVWAGANVVETHGGWIRVVEPDSLGGRSRVIGPGRALVATGEARSIAALVPRPSVKPGESPYQLVIYHTKR